MNIIPLTILFFVLGFILCHLFASGRHGDLPRGAVSNHDYGWHRLRNLIVLILLLTKRIDLINNYFRHELLYFIDLLNSNI